jgi:hypothetical protein
MTKDEWALLERELSSLYGSAELTIDGYTVTFQTGLCDRRLVIAVYVNGWMKGEWVVNKTEECKRFCRPVVTNLFKPSERKRLTKGFSKSMIKKYFPNIDKKGEYYSPHWLTFAPLKRHLIANNKSVVLVRPALVAAPSGGVV